MKSSCLTQNHSVLSKVMFFWVERKIYSIFFSYYFYVMPEGLTLEYCLTEKIFFLCLRYTDISSPSKNVR